MPRWGEDFDEEEDLEEYEDYHNPGEIQDEVDTDGRTISDADPGL